MRIIILRSVVADLARGRDFYEQQGEGLGDYFEESLTADIDSPRLYAGIHVLAHGYHRMLSDRFPYAIYYELTGEQIRIRAVLDCRRDPKWIRLRMRQGQANNGIDGDDYEGRWSRRSLLFRAPSNQDDGIALERG